MSVAQILLPALGGGLTTLLAESLLRPRPRLLTRPGASYLIHAGIWLALFGGLLALVQRPLFAAALGFACWLLVILVSNAKYVSLREPFVFVDFEYFRDAIKHPRLYLPFLGLGRALVGAGVFAAAGYGGLTLEPSLTASLGADAFWRLAVLFPLLAAALLALGTRSAPAFTLEPVADMERFGLGACLWLYGLAHRRPPLLPEGLPFAASPANARPLLPHVVAVQSESFFDARRLCAGIRPDLLPHFDALGRDSLAHGPLVVPAWGANTIRSEFAFLSGLDEAALGVHRFNPYHAFIRRSLPTLASYLRSLGYRTVCIHPYPASFYARDQVFPRFGFDEFVDIRAFDGAARFGPYVSDAAVTDRLLDLLDGSDGRPLFLFAITMENHGPLHLEHVDEGEAERYFQAPPPPGWNDLTVYLRHLAHADAMIGRLRAGLASQDRPGCLCFYGDHVPILADIYATTGFADGRTDYVVWSTEKAVSTRLEERPLVSVGQLLLEAAGLYKAGSLGSTLNSPDRTPQ